MRRRSFLCECSGRRCRERVYLSERDYRKLARQGRVVTPGHEDGTVVSRVFGAVVIQDRAVVA